MIMEIALDAFLVLLAAESDGYYQGGSDQNLRGRTRLQRNAVATSPR
jgi:hypothetical protein